MSSDQIADSILTSLKNEVVKVFKVYDGSDRLIEQYEALANAPDQAPCLKTEYTYIGATTKVEKMKESRGVWLAAYDI
jgi:hypothetical protein